MSSGVDDYTKAIEFAGPDYLPCRIGVNLDWLQDRDGVTSHSIMPETPPDNIIAMYETFLEYS